MLLNYIVILSIARSSPKKPQRHILSCYNHIAGYSFYEAIIWKNTIIWHNQQ